jgi:twinkle protein
MESAYDILKLFSIELRSFSPGNHKTRCPKCSETRRNKREPCLSVLIDDAGVTWRCHHCGWEEGRGYSRPSGGGWKPKAALRPAKTYDAMNWAVAHNWRGGRTYG